jgi:hypothetical protein
MANGSGNQLRTAKISRKAAKSRKNKNTNGSGAVGVMGFSPGAVCLIQRVIYRTEQAPPLPARFYDTIFRYISLILYLS